MRKTRTLLATFIASTTISHSALANDSFDELDQAHFEVQREMAYEFEGCSAQEFAMEQARVKKLKSMMNERQETISSLESQINTLKANQKSCNTSSLEEQVASLKAQNGKLENRLTQLTQNLKQANADLLNKSGDSATITTLRKNLSTTQAQLSEAQIQNNKLISQITQLRSQLAQNQTTPLAAAPIAAPAVQNTMGFGGQDIEKLKINKVSASTFYSNSHSPYKAQDERTNTYWSTLRDHTEDQYLKLNLRDPKIVSQIKFHFPNRTEAQPPKEAILLFSDGSKQKISIRDMAEWQTIKFNPVQTESVKIKFGKQHNPGMGSRYIYVSEVEIYGY